MAIRLEIKHSMLRRCRGWDYRQPCIYQITLVLADRKSKALGRLEIPALPSGAQDRPLSAQDRPLQVQGRLLQAQNASGSSVPSAEAIGLALALAASAEIALTQAARR